MLMRRLSERAVRALAVLGMLAGALAGLGTGTATAASCQGWTGDSRRARQGVDGGGQRGQVRAVTGGH